MWRKKIRYGAFKLILERESDKMIVNGFLLITETSVIETGEDEDLYVWPSLKDYISGAESRPSREMTARTEEAGMVYTYDGEEERCRVLKVVRM